MTKITFFLFISDPETPARVYLTEYNFNFFYIDFYHFCFFHSSILFYFSQNTQTDILKKSLENLLLKLSVVNFIFYGKHIEFTCN